MSHTRLLSAGHDTAIKIHIRRIPGTDFHLEIDGSEPMLCGQLQLQVTFSILHAYTVNYVRVYLLWL